VHHDVERLLAEVGDERVRDAVDGAVADVLVALALAQLRRDLLVAVEHGVERIDLLEGEQRAVGEAARFVHLSALEKVQEDVEGGGPRADAYGGACLGEGLRDGEAEAAVVGHAGDEGTAAGQVDVEHHGIMTRGIARARATCAPSHLRSAGQMRTIALVPTPGHQFVYAKQGCHGDAALRRR